MSGEARDFNNIETRDVVNFFLPLQGKAPKEIYASLTETLGEYGSSYATLNNWVAHFKRGDLYEGHLESKERFAIQRYLLII